MSFADFKKKRGDVSRLTEAVDKLNEFQKKSDERFWTLTVDKAGTGSATIRFLDACEGEDAPFVRMFNHAFKGPSGRWYIENCRSTIGQADPVMEMNSELWNSTTDDESPARKQVRLQKRKTTFISNILVIKDSANPDNEGKVFLFKYGLKIFEKIQGKLKPKYEDEAPANPFDFWEGMNFKLRAKSVSKQRNYDDSEFEESSALFDGNDKKIETLWKSLYPLQPLIAEDQFKSYDELSKLLNTVLNSKPRKEDDTPFNDELEDEVEHRPIQKAAAVKSAPEKKIENKAPWADDDDDEDLQEFKRLAGRG